MTAAPATTAAMLWKAILAAPLDAAPKLALCDHLEETGQDPDLLAGLKWCRRVGCFPQKWNIMALGGPGEPCWGKYNAWRWYPPRDRYSHGPVRGRVPIKLWREIATSPEGDKANKGTSLSGYNGCVSPDPETAVRRLGRAVRQLGVG